MRDRGGAGRVRCSFDPAAPRSRSGTPACRHPLGKEEDEVRHENWRALGEGMTNPMSGGFHTSFR